MLDIAIDYVSKLFSSVGTLPLAAVLIRAELPLRVSDTERMSL